MTSIKCIKFFLFVFVILLGLPGCGEKKIDFSSGSDSLERILSKMDLKERAYFLDDIDLLIKLKGDVFAAQGYTVSEIRKEAALGRMYVSEKNRKFLGPLIEEMEKSGKRETSSVMINDAGIYMNIKTGYLAKTRRLEDLKAAYEKSLIQPSVKGVRQSPVSGDPIQTKPSKMLGDVIDDNLDATPNTAEDVLNKSFKKAWQDNNGFMHYPDGSASAGPVD